MPFATTWMNLKTIILREISQIKTNIIHCNWAIQKNDTSELIYKTEGQRMNLSMKQKQSFRSRKQTYGYQGGKVSGINQEFGERDKLGDWD